MTAYPNYTPGPWRAFRKEYLSEQDDGYWFIAGDASFADDTQWGDFEICGFVGNANAQVMACAPELLGQCKKALAAWEGSGPAISLDDLRAVIAKAEKLGN